MSKTAAQNLLTGQAGVWRVAAELALRGVNPYFPGVDHGCDLVAEGRIRIQVKSASLRHNKRVYPDGAYWFKFWDAPIVSGANNIRRRGWRDYTQEVDFVVFWGVNEDRFWVVPTPLIAKGQCFVVGPQGFYKRQDFQQTRELRDLGYSQQDIADRLGVTQSAVSYQLRGGRKQQPKKTFTAIIREHENRWDLITGALATLTEANDVVSQSLAPERALTE